MLLSVGVSTRIFLELGDELERLHESLRELLASRDADGSSNSPRGGGTRDSVLREKLLLTSRGEVGGAAAAADADAPSAATRGKYGDEVRMLARRLGWLRSDMTLLASAVPAKAGKAPGALGGAAVDGAAAADNDMEGGASPFELLLTLCSCSEEFVLGLRGEVEAEERAEAESRHAEHLCAAAEFVRVHVPPEADGAGGKRGGRLLLKQRKVAAEGEAAAADAAAEDEGGDVLEDRALADAGDDDEEEADSDADADGGDDDTVERGLDGPLFACTLRWLEHRAKQRAHPTARAEDSEDEEDEEDPVDAIAALCHEPAEVQQLVEDLMRGASELRAAEGATGHATGQGARPPAGPPLGAGEAGSWRVGLEAARPTLEALASVLCTPVWLYYCVDDAPASATAAADARPIEAFDQALDQALEGPKARHRRPTEVVAPPLASVAQR